MKWHLNSFFCFIRKYDKIKYNIFINIIYIVMRFSNFSNNLSQMTISSNFTYLSPKGDKDRENLNLWLGCMKSW